MKVDGRHRGPCLFTWAVPYYERKGGGRIARGRIHSMSYPLTDFDGIDDETAEMILREMATFEAAGVSDSGA